MKSKKIGSVVGLLVSYLLLLVFFEPLNSVLKQEYQFALVTLVWTAIFYALNRDNEHVKFETALFLLLGPTVILSVMVLLGGVVAVWFLSGQS